MCRLLQKKDQNGSSNVKTLYSPRFPVCIRPLQAAHSIVSYDVAGKLVLTQTSPKKNTELCHWV